MSVNSQTTNDGITYTNQATFFSPNVPFFLRNGEVLIDPVFKDSIIIQSEFLNETATIVNQDKNSASVEPTTGLKEVLVMKNRETTAVRANGAVYIKGNVSNAVKPTSVGLLACNVSDITPSAQLTVSNDIFNNTRVNLLAPTRLQIGINPPYMMSAASRGLSNQMLIGTEAKVLGLIGDIEIGDNGVVKIETNTKVENDGISTGDLQTGGTQAFMKRNLNTGTFGVTEIGQSKGYFSVVGGIENQAYVFGRNKVNIGCETVPAGATNNAITYDGTATSIVNTPGVTTHFWAQDFQRVASFTSTITTNATVTNVTVTGNLNVNGLTVDAINTNTLDVNTSAFINDISCNIINGTPIANPFTAFVPTGVIFPIASATYANGAVPPVGYLYCDGASYAIAAYPSLSAALGTTYGGVPGVSFNVPDMRAGKTIIGGVMYNNGASFQIINAAANMLNYSVNSILVDGNQYGTNFRNFNLKPALGNVYTGPGLRPGYSFTVINGTGTRYNIIESLGAPFGNNARGPEYNLFLTDVPIDASDRAVIGALNGGINVFTSPTDDLLFNSSISLLPNVKAGSNNNYLNYTQRPTEVGGTTYTVFRGGVGAPSGGSFAAGDPNIGVRSEYLNALGNYTDAFNNNIRNPVSSNIPSAYSYAMMYIIKT